MTGVEVRDGHGRGPPGGAGALCVLVSFTPRYAIYGDALCRGLRASRPDVRVELAPFPDTAGAVARLRPHLVFSDGAVPAPGTAKARISTEPTEPSTMRLQGLVRTIVNPTFGDLLAFVREVEQAVGGDP